MPTFLQLVRRDHDDLETGLRELIRPRLPTSDLCDALDGVRLALSAHAEAEDIVLYAALVDYTPPAFVQQLVAEARRAHLAQESAFAGLVRTVPETATWRGRAQRLLDLIRRHAVQEEREVIPALRDHLPIAGFARLAGAFATERLRQLAALQPSGVYALDDVAAPFLAAS